MFFKETLETHRPPLREDASKEEVRAVLLRSGERKSPCWPLVRMVKSSNSRSNSKKSTKSEPLKSEAKTPPADDKKVSTPKRGRDAKAKENKSTTPTAPATPEVVQSLPFSDPPLGDVDDFVKEHPLYKHMVVTVYQIVRDLHIKQDVTNIEIVDGRRWGRRQYFIKATSRIDGVKRLMVPFGLDEDIDLPWIHSLCLESERNDMALVVCLHTPESIVYETIHSELP